ncbi:MAG: hypothetical protein AAF438_09990 [Pseudomonadota bacterium]
MQNIGHSMANDDRYGSFMQELQRRNVVRFGLVYILVAWVLLQLGSILFAAINLPPWTIRFIGALFILGFPPAVIFAWVFELTPEGIKREREVEMNRSITTSTGRKLDIISITALVVGLAVFGLQKIA